MKPFDLIASYFHPQGGGNRAALGLPDKIAGVATTVLGVIAGLPLMYLSDLANQALERKDAAAQRRRSLAFQRFLTRRPDYAAALDIPSETYQQVVDKDEAVDLLLVTLFFVRESIDHAGLLLAASLSGRVRRVLNHVIAISGKEGTLSWEEEKIKTHFGPVLYEHLASESRAERKLKERQRSVDSAKKKVQEAQERAVDLSLLARLIRDARTGDPQAIALAPAPADKDQ